MDFIKKAVILMLACMAFLLEIKAAEDILTNSDKGFRYKYLGCYSDEPSPRAFTQMYYNAKSQRFINWKIKGYNLKKVLDTCAAHARDKGMSVFGVQYYGECWGGGSSYNRYSVSKNCLEGLKNHWVGKDWTNAVYELISAECEVNGMTYKNGDTIYIPQNPIQYNDISCQECSCDKGVKNCGQTIKCDQLRSFPCEKVIPAPQGSCCPTCACYHKNMTYKDGHTWINRKPNVCYECTCVSNQATCNIMACAANCPNPVYEPGKCCPTCHAGAPATEAAFTIPETTTRPPPVLPPFPGFPGNQKRGLKLKKRVKRSNN